jgi:hypothetical protein
MGQAAKFMIFVLIAGALSCGKKDEPAENIYQEQQQQSDGLYSFSLRPVNPSLAPEVSGEGFIKISGDEFRMKLVADGLPRGLHVQRSPGAMDDKNGDGLVDVVESHASTGAVLVPLDGDLHTQKGGSETYPYGKKIRYSRSAYHSSLLADLRKEAPDHSSLGELRPDEVLNLHGKVIEIHGVGENTILPSTVKTVGGLPARETLPVACGRIKRTGF